VTDVLRYPATRTVGVVEDLFGERLPDPYRWLEDGASPETRDWTAAQNALTVKLRQASAKAGNADFYALWAGQAVPLARALPAAELIAQLEQETIAAIRKVASFVKE